MWTISNCIHHFVQVIAKLKKYCIRVSEKIFATILGSILNLKKYCPLNEIIWYNSIIIDEGNQALQEFLAARNPKQQHSSTLESYLIKPIQRILKYPLLLQQLRNLTDPRCEEHLHLVGAYKKNIQLWRPEFH